MVVKIEVMQIKERCLTENFYLPNDKGDKASKQTLKHYYTSIWHDLTPAN